MRGPEETVSNILNSLAVLLPKKWSNIVPYSEEYLKPDVCNLLGMGLHVAVPQPSEQSLRIDIVENIYHVKWMGTLPDKGILVQ